MNAWIITCDHLFEEGDECCVKGEVFAPEGRHEEAKAILKDSKTRQHFKIYDDDKELYYTGFATAECEFEPLDWAMRHAGATEIRYRNRETGKFETL